MAPPPKLSFHPPLLNSACPWATGIEDLRQLLQCPSTGAVTTRTSLLRGFKHDDAAHRYLFFDPSTGKPGFGTSSNSEPPESSPLFASASLNSLGYSPHTLNEYLDMIRELARDPELSETGKTFIISVTGSAADVRECYDIIVLAAPSVPFPLAVEINLSCPNIPGAPPPAYDGAALTRYLEALPEQPSIPIGVKAPPYTYHAQFVMFIDALKPLASRISFVTSTNTLGSCLVLDESTQLPGLGFGGMAGPPLHPLALGNAATIRRMLDEAETLNHIQVIGVGGVGDGDGYRRFKKVGAYAVAAGTALGKHGTGVFQKIEEDLQSVWE
ncbi:hypothetical protein B0I35DRAFT_424366 [Stachybotrys elegans]|uniref:Dihydroorotate dehydrogenase (fumarate) n=1 Tax=Stachybotrys elegans TaxID=80388 RepID=A0A8K0T0T0_9HYPO|nr:hypothetical protein B0I35DRAFT_424366 [Stachybotrys elegans]